MPAIQRPDDGFESISPWEWVVFGSMVASIVVVTSVLVWGG